MLISALNTQKKSFILCFKDSDFKSVDGGFQWDPKQLWSLIKSRAYNEVVNTYFPPSDSRGLQDIIRVAAENHIKDSMEALDNAGELIS